MNPILDVSTAITSVMICTYFFGGGYINRFFKWRKERTQMKLDAMLQAKQLDLEIAQENSKRAQLEIEHYDRQRQDQKSLEP